MVRGRETRAQPVAGRQGLVRRSPDLAAKGTEGLPEFWRGA